MPCKTRATYEVSVVLELVTLTLVMVVIWAEAAAAHARTAAIVLNCMAVKKLRNFFDE